MPLDYSVNMMPWMSAGAFGSYDSYMPSSMGMGMGMMYNPAMMGAGYMMPNYMDMMLKYQEAMQKMQAQAEINQANHSATMHGITTENEVKAKQERMNADFDTLAQDAAMQQGIDSLYRKIQAGDGKGVCQEYDKLKASVFSTFKGRFPDNQNPENVAMQKIEELYASIISHEYGGTHSLVNDIQENCDSAFTNGFNQTFRSGHSDVYADQILSHIKGERIDAEESKRQQQDLGKVAGYGGRVVKDLTIGAAVGAGTYSVGHLAKKGFVGAWFGNKTATPTPGGTAPKKLKFGQKAGRWACIGAFAMLAGDFIWSKCLS